jgi:hypothetical protein
MLGDTSFGGAFKLSIHGGELTNLGVGAGVAIDDECVYTGSAITGVSSFAKSYDGD